MSLLEGTIIKKITYLTLHMLGRNKGPFKYLMTATRRKMKAKWRIGVIWGNRDYTDLAIISKKI